MSSEPQHSTAAGERPWDARLARQLVEPLKDSWVTPNHLTSLRLLIGLAAAAAFIPGTYVWSNVASLLLVLSNFADHTDGELARISGKSSRAGHIYDLASDAVVTILLFIGIGMGVGAKSAVVLGFPPLALGAAAGSAIAVIFFLRMRIEEMAGKGATRQAELSGFETEDVLYLLPLVTLCDAVAGFLLTAFICAPLFAIWVAIDYLRVMRRQRSTAASATARVAQ
jgi:archaetidylinositol phosphate synthase